MNLFFNPNLFGEQIDIAEQELRIAHKLHYDMSVLLQSLPNEMTGQCGHIVQKTGRLVDYYSRKLIMLEDMLYRYHFMITNNTKTLTELSANMTALQKEYD